MYLIKSCPSCDGKLRFPINAGKIKVRCKCGHAFIADPDSPSLFKEAEFDIRPDTKPGFKNKLENKLKNIQDFSRLKNILPVIIKLFFDFKYKMFNFRILPDSEKRKIIIYFIIIALIITLVIICIPFISSLGKIESGII